MPDFPIVDAHVHVYDLSLEHPWMAGAPRLAEPHPPERFFASTGGVEVEAAVFVEVDVAAGRHLDEAAYVARVAEAEPRIRGAVFAAPLERGAEAVAADLDRIAAIPLARGVRRLIQAHRDEPGWALREPFVEAVRAVGARGLSFDLCIHAPQLAEATELVRRRPEVRFVLDHIGKPEIRAGRLDPWRDELRALSRLPNVWLKLSGVATEADHERWREDELLPYIRHALDCFGVERAMFGGDWPVSTLAIDYARWVALVEDALAGASEDERRRLFRGTATEVYRLG